jgi:mono/diheme cytochrome c family protein
MTTIDVYILTSYNPPMTRRLTSAVTLVLGCILFIMSCTSTYKAISNVDATPATVETQLANGAPIYAQTCATSTCHGRQGEGIRSGNTFKAWPLIGDEFQARHPNAKIVFDVIRSGNERNLLALTDQQIYDAIAYELSQNQIALKTPLTADNAFTTHGGKMAGQTQGGLFPPSDNVTFIDSPHTRDLPIAARNNQLRLQLDQIAQASTIGNHQGVFLILVIAFSDLDDKPITISPKYLKLSTPSGKVLEPQSINIHSAIEQFHEQTIKPQYGTVGLVVFTLSAPDDFDQLMYDDGTGDRLNMALKP